MKKVTKTVKPEEKASLGKRIEYVRTNRGMSQKDLANKLHKSRENLSQIENDDRGLDIVSLKLITKELNVSSDYLLGLTDFESIEIEDKAINKKLGLEDNAIYNIGLFNMIEKEIASGKEYNKVYLLNRILENKKFLDSITSSISDCYKKVLEEAIVNNFPNVKGGSLKKAMLEKEFSFAIFNVQNAFVEMFNEMNKDFINGLGVQVDEENEEDYV